MTASEVPWGERGRRCWGGGQESEAGCLSPGVLTDGCPGPYGGRVLRSSILGIRPGGPGENADGLNESEKRRPGSGQRRVGIWKQQRVKHKRPRGLVSRDAEGAGGGGGRGGSFWAGNFSGASAVTKKKSACKTEDAGNAIGSIPGLGRCLRGGPGNPLQDSCLENPTDRGAWRGCRVIESDSRLSRSVCRVWSVCRVSRLRPS